jgi:prophage maintenance system killer protein
MLPNNKNIDNQNILELVRMFADTWLSLDAYDKDNLETKGYTEKKVSLTAKKLSGNIEILKTELISKNEASDLFARENKAENLAGIIGNVMQAFGGRDLYATIEEKAANLFYLIIKNYPFIDGNKRSGAYAFIWFLNQAKVLNTNKINPPALTALTILIAESHPKEKEKMIKIILTILGKRN